MHEKVNAPAWRVCLNFDTRDIPINANSKIMQWISYEIIEN